MFFSGIFVLPNPHLLVFVESGRMLQTGSGNLNIVEKSQSYCELPKRKCYRRCRAKTGQKTIPFAYLGGVILWTPSVVHPLILPTTSSLINGLNTTNRYVTLVWWAPTPGITNESPIFSKSNSTMHNPTLGTTCKSNHKLYIMSQNVRRKRRMTYFVRYVVSQNIRRRRRVSYLIRQFLIQRFRNRLFQRIFE